MDAIALLFALEKSKRTRMWGKTEIRHVGENVAGRMMMTHRWGCCMCVKSINPTQLRENARSIPGENGQEICGEGGAVRADRKRTKFL